MQTLFSFLLSYFVVVNIQQKYELGFQMIGLHKLSSALFSGAIKGHFGQWAEDVLVRKLFPKNKKTGVYLDLGAYHPFTHSNTAYFWMKGWRGYNVDANPKTIQLFNKIRPGDENIWNAIVPSADYDRGIRDVALLLPTQSDSPQGIAATGTVNQAVGGERGFSNSIHVPALSVSELIRAKNISNIDYLNIDIEGFDEIILKEIDFSILHPLAVTVEDYSSHLIDLGSSNITQWMHSQHYNLVGRAGPTSIFLRNA
jgi:FkbM family methyltransferase